MGCFKILLKNITLLLFFMPSYSMQLSQQELDKKLFNALEENASLEEIRTLIACGADVNATNRNGHKPLFLVLQQQYYYMHDSREKVFLLLDAGAQLHYIRPGYTAFHYVAYNNDLDMSLKLIEYAQKRDWGVTTAKTVLLMKKYFPKKFPFPKPIIFLILNTMKEVSILFPLVEKYQFLREILEKKSEIWIDEEFNNKMACELPRLGIKRFFPRDLYWVNRNHYLEGQLNLREEKNKLKMRGQAINELLNPAKY